MIFKRRANGETQTPGAMVTNGALIKGEITWEK